MQNETRHAFGFIDATIRARRRATSTNVVPAQAKIRVKWARWYEKGKTFSKLEQDEENDISQSEKQDDTSE